jgi:hypothetical protein
MSRPKKEESKVITFRVSERVFKLLEAASSKYNDPLGNQFSVNDLARLLMMQMLNGVTNGESLKAAVEDESDDKSE